MSEPQLPHPFQAASVDDPQALDAILRSPQFGGLRPAPFGVGITVGRDDALPDRHDGALQSRGTSVRGRASHLGFAGTALLLTSCKPIVMDAREDGLPCPSANTVGVTADGGAQYGCTASDSPYCNAAGGPTSYLCIWKRWIVGEPTRVSSVMSHHPSTASRTSHERVPATGHNA